MAFSDNFSSQIIFLIFSTNWQSTAISQLPDWMYWQSSPVTSQHFDFLFMLVSFHRNVCFNRSLHLFSQRNSSFSLIKLNTDCAIGDRISYSISDLTTLTLQSKPSPSEGRSFRLKTTVVSFEQTCSGLYHLLIELTHMRILSQALFYPAPMNIQTIWIN